MLNGAICEAGAMIARSDDSAATQKQVPRELKALLDSLRVDTTR
ncbi:MAG: hypothetical protein WD942_05690 [Dehalococcoidia bacterium]